MVMVCKLVRGSDTVNLVTGPESQKGWRIQGWKPASGLPVSGQDLATVVEHMDLLCDAASHDSLATYLQNLDDMRRLAANFRGDQTEREPVWFHVKMDQETGERRSMVQQADLKWSSDQIAQTGGAQEGRVKIRLTLERSPWWETDTGVNFPTASESAGVCIVYDYTNGGAQLIQGNLPARIDGHGMHSDATGARVGRLWLGLRSADKHGTLGNFANIWELEDSDATLGTDAARAADVTASPTGGGNTKVTVTPGTATWANRLEIELQDVLANISHTPDNYGLYLWLLRYKLSGASSTWEAQLRFGYSATADDDFRRGPVIELSNNAWDYVEMGAQMIPIQGRAIEIATYEAYNTIQVWARRTSGSTNLDIDCLIPLPIDEGWLKIWGLDLAAGSLAWLYLFEMPDGRVGAFQYDANGILATGAVAADRFRLPIGDGRMYIVYAGPSDSDITTGGISQLGDFEGIRERWLNLRGAD